MKQKTNKRKEKKQRHVRLIDLIFDGLATLHGLFKAETNCKNNA